VDKKTTIDELACRVNMSTRNLRHSPGITMREIASRCGFANERQLQRILKGGQAITTTS
jgi:transcriptional regulator GlxA family with amidase domain